MEIDKDLAARQEARLLCRQAETAQKLLEKFPQEKLDAIVENIAKKFSAATCIACVPIKVLPPPVGSRKQT